MKFYNATGQMCVNAAVAKANQLLQHGSPMIQELGNRNDWKYDSGTGLEVAELLLAERPIVNVFFYKPKWPWSKAIGYYERGELFINKRRFAEFSEAELVGLLLHEYSHHCGFHHGNNYKTAHKVKYSVPYYLSENVRKWL